MKNIKSKRSFARAMFTSLSFASLLLLLGQLSAFAGNREDNGHLLKEVTVRLRENLAREDGLPVYHEAYKNWESRVPELEKSLDVAPEEFERLISREFGGLKMSHLAFYKLKEGTLGMEVGKEADGSFKVTKVYPFGPAEKAGIKVSDVVINIDDKSPDEVLGQALPEESDSFVTLADDKGGAPKKIRLIRTPHASLMKGKMGVTTQNETDGTIVIKSIAKHSAAKLAGLKTGDKILSIDGEVPRKRLDRGTVPGELSSFIVQRAGGEREQLELRYQSDAYQQSPKFSVIDKDNKKAVYLSIPNFTTFYDPNTIHSAMLEAEKAGVLIVDLRNNGGGRSDHFLSYLLSPETNLCTQVGVKFNPKQNSLNKVFSVVLLAKANSSFDKLVEIYLSQNPRNAQAFLLAYEKWGEHILDNTSMYHEIPSSLRILLEARQESLRDIVEGKNAGCGIPGSKWANDGKEKLKDDLSAWKTETIRQMADIFSGKLIQSRPCKIPSKRDTENWKSFLGVWGQLPKEPSFPYHGKVAFLVNENTYCSAEACAIIPLEYQDLKGRGKIKGLPYKDQLNASAIKVIGNTKGGAQGRGTSTIKTDRGSYHVMFPVYDLYTHVHNKRIEGSGITKSSTLDEDSVTAPRMDDEADKSSTENEELEPALFKQVMEWAMGPQK